MLYQWQEVLGTAIYGFMLEDLCAKENVSKTPSLIFTLEKHMYLIQQMHMGLRSFSFALI